jgi:large subunit ribosomal protein L9
LPQRLAKPATEDAIRSISEEKTKRAEQRRLEGRRLQAAAEAVDGAEAVVAAKANEQGHLFGSVTARQIAANLRSQGFEVADEIVQLHEHIKQIGTHAVTLKFAADVTATVNVVVVPEKDAADAESTPETTEET